MAFFLTKEYREKRAREKEYERQMEMEREEREKKQKMRYCNWYSHQTQNFIDELKGKGFKASWGFEVESSDAHYTEKGGIKIGDIYVFDVPALEGLAFDMESKQMLYFTCPTGYYERFCKPNTKVDYKYVLIPFYEIFKANIEVNSQPFVSTVSSKRNSISKSIAEGIVEGLLGDDEDDIIDWETEDDNYLVVESGTSLYKVVLNIQTTNPDHPIISFEFIKQYNPDPRCAGSNKAMIDTMCSIFSGSDELVDFTEYNTRRNCGTFVDYYYDRLRIEPENDENKLSRKIFIISEILERLNRYVMRIELIIQQCNKELVNHAKKENIDNMVSQLKELADLKEKGVITEKEFIKLKKRLIST